MTRNNLKKVVLAFIFTSALPLAACGDKNDTPTSPSATTQPGPTVSTPTTTTPAPTPEPTPTPAPSPTPTAPDNNQTTVSGTVFTLSRGGASGMDISFRINDTTTVNAGGGTPVIQGSAVLGTDSIRGGEKVTVTGTLNGSVLTASSIVVDATQ